MSKNDINENLISEMRNNKRLPVVTGGGGGGKELIENALKKNYVSPYPSENRPNFFEWVISFFIRNPLRKSKSEGFPCCHFQAKSEGFPPLVTRRK